MAYQIAVNFDRMQRACLLWQRRQHGLRQGGQSGADLDDEILRLRRYGLNNGVDDAVINQKILPEAFACNMGCAHGAWGVMVNG